MARLPILYLLFTLGGFSALVYEVMWAREFRLVFGNSTRSAAVVLAAYLGGMALGNLIGARLARRANPLRLYGFAELLVALGALLVAGWLAIYQNVYPSVYQLTDGQSGWLTVAKMALALLAIGPPAMAMGATWPLMVRAAVSTTGHVARRTGSLYAVNVIGGAAGIAVAGFVTPISLGVRNTLWIAVAINLLIGIVAWFLSRREGEAPAEPKQREGEAPAEPENGESLTARREPRPPKTSRPVTLLLAAAVSGYGVLSLEVLYTRMLSQRSRGSVYAFALMLLVVLLSLAIGSLVVALRLDRNRPWRFLAWTQAAAVIAILVSPLMFHLQPTIATFVQPTTYAGGLWTTALASAVLMGPAMILAGMLLPSLWKIVGIDVDSLGSDVGKLTALNTIAAVVGALVTGFVCLPHLSMSASFLVVAGLYTIVAVIAWWNAFAGIRRWSGIAACAAIATSWFFSEIWKVEFHTLKPGERLVQYHDGEAATVAVIEQNNGQRTLTTNQNYILGSTTAAGREIRQGRLPLLLHPAPKRVAFIGVATGLTVSGALDFPVEKVDAMELIPGVAVAAREFDAWNRKCLADPRVDLVVADGRNHLLGTAARYDVIISDLFVPWHAGTGDLYTVEHFRICRERLAEGGLFAQWLPGYQLTVEELKTITASFLEAFPAATLWRNDFHVQRPIIGLIGYRSASEQRLDPAAVGVSCQRMSQGRPRANYLATPDGLQLLFVAGDADLRKWVRGAALNTDDRPIIEYGTPRSAFEHRQRRQVRPVLDQLASFRPRNWPYQDTPRSDHSTEELFAAADLMHDALIANAGHNFGAEYRLASQLADLAGDVPVVSQFVIEVAARFGQRQMTARGNELLGALAEKSDHSLPVVLALIQAKRLEGDDQATIKYLRRAVELAPDQAVLRQTLADRLTTDGQFADAEPHWRQLVEKSPENAELRLDLARVLHRQEKRAEAAEQIAVFRKLDLGDRRAQWWSRLRTFGLGVYVDRPATAVRDAPAKERQPQEGADPGDGEPIREGEAPAEP